EEAVVEAERAAGVTLRFIPDIVRNVGLVSADRTLEWALADRTGRVAAIGLAGIENGYPNEPFREHFEAARGSGRRCPRGRARRARLDPLDARRRRAGPPRPRRARGRGSGPPRRSRAEPHSARRLPLLERLPGRRPRPREPPVRSPPPRGRERQRQHRRSAVLRHRSDHRVPPPRANLRLRRGRPRRALSRGAPGRVPARGAEGRDGAGIPPPVRRAGGGAPGRGGRAEPFVAPRRSVSSLVRILQRQLRTATTAMSSGHSVSPAQARSAAKRVSIDSSAVAPERPRDSTTWVMRSIPYSLPAASRASETPSV